MLMQNTAAIVTGGASGLGLATARHLRKLGVQVQVLDLPPRAGAHDHLLADDIGFSGGDVRSEADVQAALDQATAGGLPLRVVVNCAGVVSGARVLGRHGVHPLEDFARTVEINLVGTFNVIRLAAARMARNDLDGGTGSCGEHRVDRRVRRADWTSCLCRVQSRRQRPHAPPGA